MGSSAQFRLLKFSIREIQSKNDELLHLPLLLMVDLGYVSNQWYLLCSKFVLERFKGEILRLPFKLAKKYSHLSSELHCWRA